MNEQAYNQLREASWRRRLTAAEEARVQAWLDGHPEARAEWEAEAGLNRVLELAEPPPVSSNFTAQVLQKLELVKAAQARAARKARLAWWRVLVLRTACAVVVVGAGLLAYNRVETQKRRALTEQAAQVSQIVAASNPDLLEDFDAIDRLSSKQPAADVELYALLK